MNKHVSIELDLKDFSERRYYISELLRDKEWRKSIVAVQTHLQARYYFEIISGYYDKDEIEKKDFNNLNLQLKNGQKYKFVYESQNIQGIDLDYNRVILIGDIDLAFLSGVLNISLHSKNRCIIMMGN